MPQEKTCAHPACNCLVDGDTEYCSDYCEDAEASDTSCKCAHAGCAVGGKARTAQPS